MRQPIFTVRSFLQKKPKQKRNHSFLQIRRGYPDLLNTTPATHSPVAASWLIQLHNTVTTALPSVTVS